jgi:hypothetical protein
MEAVMEGVMEAVVVAGEEEAVAEETTMQAVAVEEVSCDLCLDR